MAGFTSSGALILCGGEPNIVHWTLKDAQGAAQLLTGRSFLFAWRRTSQIAPADDPIAAVLSDDAYYLIVTIDGPASLAIYEAAQAKAYSFDLLEDIGGGTTIRRDTGRIALEAGAGSSTGGTIADRSIPYADAMVNPSSRAVTELGADGKSAAELFAIGGIDGNDPTTNAMFAALGDGIRAEVQDIADAAGERAASSAESANNSQGSASDAAGSAATADVAKVTAQGYRDQAALSAQSANDAMAAAILSANRYADTTSGLAATSNGQYFSVVGTGSTFLTLYLNSSGTAVFKNSLSAKSAMDAITGTFRIDSSETEFLWSVANLNGDRLIAFRASLGGLDIPNLRAQAISAVSVSAPTMTASTVIFLGTAAISATLNPGNLQEWRTTIGDIVMKLDVTGTLSVPSISVGGTLTVGGLLTAASFNVAGALSAGSLTIGAASIGTTTQNLVEWKTPIGDIVARIDLSGKPHFASTYVEGDLYVTTGKIYGTLADEPISNAYASVSSTTLGWVNGVTPAGIPGGVAPAPSLSNDSGTYGVRHSHISSSAVFIGHRCWTINYGKIGVAQITGYISGTTLTVVSINNPYHIEAGATVTGAGVTAGTTIASFVSTWTVSVSQTVGSAGSPVTMSLTGPDGTTSITGYISGTTLTILSAVTPAYVVQDTTLTGAGVTTCQLVQAIANVGPGNYTISPSQTVGSAGSPVALTVTDAAGNGAEGYSGYAFLSYCDDVFANPPIWSEPLYFIAPNPLTDSVIGQIGADASGRLLILIEMSRDATTSTNYGYIITNPQARSGSFDIGRGNYLGADWSMQVPQIVGQDVYVPNDYKPTGVYATRIGKLIFSGRDGVTFAQMSGTYVKPPSGQENFGESSIFMVSANQCRVFLRSTLGIQESLSTPDLAAWGAPTLWKARTGWDSPASRSNFARSPTGRCVAVWNNATSRTNLTLAISEDEGVTWPWSVPMETTNLVGKSPSYPCVVFYKDRSGTRWVGAQYDLGRRPDATGGKSIVIALIKEEKVRSGTATEADFVKIIVTN